MDKMEREPGFYWVDKGDHREREVALWNGRWWFVVGSPGTFEAGEFTPIGPRIEPPTT